MNGLIIHEAPERKIRAMIVALGGWPDAAGAATRAARHLRRVYKPRKIAEFDPEHYYDFTSTRPRTMLLSNRERLITWPVNDFHVHLPEEDSSSFVLFSGVEPHLRWKTYCNAIVDVAESLGVTTMASLGALFGVVPHTRPFPVSATVSSHERLAARVQEAGAFVSPYQGEAAIQTVLADICAKRGIDHVSFWGHGPHYLSSLPNLKMSLALLERIERLFGLGLNLDELRGASYRYLMKANESIASDRDLTEYARRLEAAYDASQASTPLPEEPLNPEEVIRDLEEFLKRERHRPESE